MERCHSVYFFCKFNTRSDRFSLDLKDSPKWILMKKNPEQTNTIPPKPKQINKNPTAKELPPGNAACL